MIRRVGPIVALVAGAALVVLLGLGALMGLDPSGGADDAVARSGRQPGSTATSPSTPARSTTPTTPSRDPAGSREVRLTPSWVLAFGAAAPVVDKLAEQSVLRVTADGFEPFEKGVIEQCAESDCSNSFPVVFDERGNARLQYLVSDAIGDGRPRCRADDPPCVVHLHSGDKSAYVTTVFRDAAPPPRRVVVEPSAGGLVDGEPVLVSVAGFTPGERVEAMLCVAPDTSGRDRCGPPGPTAPLTIDDDGTGRTAMVIRAGKVGTDGVSCGRGTQCAVVVSSRNSSVPAPAFPIAFAAGPSAQYDVTRLLIGLAIAALLLIIGSVLVRTTDWRKPTEADTPEMDHAFFDD